jgi:hypothetical protein
MKKEDLIKKAAERGITIDETQAEKYINLSDEELANLEVSGGCPTPGNVYKNAVTDSDANGCEFFDSKSLLEKQKCSNCKRAEVSTDESNNTKIYCTCSARWDGNFTSVLLK